MSKAEEAFALIVAHGVVRSSAIAEKLDCTPANVHELLLPYVARGDLVTCDVEVRGEKLKDYRLAVSAGGRAPEIVMTGRPPRPPRVPAFALGREEPSTTPAPAARPPKPPKEVPQMSTIADKIEAALKKHGPMTTRELRKYVSDKAMPNIVLQGSKADRFVRLGGGPKSSIYGLPGQKLEDGVDMDRSTPRAGKKAEKKGSRKKAGKKGRRGAKAQRGAGRDASAGAFRPAIAHDGAILLSGAEQPGELNRAEARVLAEFLLRVNGAGVRA